MRDRVRLKLTASLIAPGAGFISQVNITDQDQRTDPGCGLIRV